MSRKSFFAGAMVVAAALTGLSATSAAAAAQAEPPCPAGAICFYNERDGGGERIYQPIYANWTADFYGARSAFNDGNPEYLDDVKVNYSYQLKTENGVETLKTSICVPQNQSRNFKTGNVGRAATITNITWVSSC